jgi:hypothetical protein
LNETGENLSNLHHHAAPGGHQTNCSSYLSTFSYFEKGNEKKKKNDVLQLTVALLSCLWIIIQPKLFGKSLLSFIFIFVFFLKFYIEILYVALVSLSSFLKY